MKTGQIHSTPMTGQMTRCDGYLDILPHHPALWTGRPSNGPPTCPRPITRPFQHSQNPRVMATRTLLRCHNHSIGEAKKLYHQISVPVLRRHVSYEVMR